MKRILCLRIGNFAAQPIDALQTVAARCKQFTPLVGIDPHVFPQSVLLDITNVVHLFGGEAALVERILGELRDHDWQLRAAVAHTPGAAWALAGYGGKDEGGRMKDEDRKRQMEDGTFSIHPSSFILHPSLSLLPLQALRLPEPIVALLHSLGVWQIEQLQALPRRELSSRFGPELLDCLDRVTGRLSEPLPAWDPPPQFEVRWLAEFPTARREAVESALEHLVRRLAAMLARAGRGAMRLECLLKCTTGRGTCEAGRLQVAVGLFRPSAWANHLVELLQVQFESLQLPGPVDSIRLTAASTAPLELRQQELFSEGHARAEPHYLSGLIDRLSNRLGHACVMRVRLVPDAQPELACHYTPLVLGLRFGEGLPTPPKPPTEGLPIRRETFGRRRGSVGDRPQQQPRPLRLLTQPVRLPGGIGGQFVFAGQQQRIVRRVGPERIETGWWRGGHHAPMVGVARDYYRIETATGRCYWVFRRPPTATRCPGTRPAGPWFLHGMFD